MWNKWQHMKKTVVRGMFRQVPCMTDREQLICRETSQQKMGPTLLLSLTSNSDSVRKSEKRLWFVFAKLHTLWILGLYLDCCLSLPFHLPYYLPTNKLRWLGILWCSIQNSTNTHHFISTSIINSISIIYWQ